MLDLGDIKVNLDSFVIGLNKRGINDSSSKLNQILDLDEKKKNYVTNNEKILHELKLLSKKIADSSKDIEGAKKLKADVSSLKQESKDLQKNIADLDQEIRNLLISLPNIPNEKVPDEAKGSLVVSASPSYQYEENLLPHWDLVKRYDLIDFETGTKITGPGFPVYKKSLAKLQRSLVNFFIDSAVQEGYQELQIPLLVNENSVFATGQLPDKEGMMYTLKSDDLYLIPTSEVPLMNIYRDMIVEYEKLPIKHVAFSSCFRREAGSWGAHVRGLNRLHQFEKVEIVQIDCPSRSYETLDSMCNHVENLLKQLDLEYRKILLHSKDMGFHASMTYDFEVYSAGQDKWLEVSSVSNCESFQSNRLKLRAKDYKNNKIKPHTLNGSAIALPRIVAALLENNQTEEGIKIPEVLIPYTKFELIS